MTSLLVLSSLGLALPGVLAGAGLEAAHLTHLGLPTSAEGSLITASATLVAGFYAGRGALRRQQQREAGDGQRARLMTTAAEQAADLDDLRGLVDDAAEALADAGAVISQLETVRADDLRATALRLSRVRARMQTRLTPLAPLSVRLDACVETVSRVAREASRGAAPERLKRLARDFDVEQLDFFDAAAALVGTQG